MSFELSLKGRARIFGDDVNTDYIISSRRKRDAKDEQEMTRFLFEDIDPAIAASLKPEDIIVAGKNFGCGSAMEVAVTVPRAAGIRAIVAKSFARTFYRNAINNGLLPVIADTHGIKEGEPIEITVTQASTFVVLGDGRIPAQGVPAELVSIFIEGGLVSYLAKHRGFAAIG
ncbi:MAG: alpha-IPM isomerase [Hyphomicrobiales bacterium]|nr:alpha-IPM isomerase [Hyphomicrobiales bacterium]